MKLIGIDETEEVCANCELFVQHCSIKRQAYGIEGFTAVNFGHCVRPRLKIRRPSDTYKNFLAIKKEMR